uniref:Uncharacterized protein n=1 Tax=Anguilla anguilla TaxID=7936 RepID=A0A0E9UJK3_ANGAN
MLSAFHFGPVPIMMPEYLLGVTN